MMAFTKYFYDQFKEAQDPRNNTYNNIFQGQTVIIPLSIVQHVEVSYPIIYGTTSYDFHTPIGINYDKITGLQIITSNTVWNYEQDCWENAIWLSAEEHDNQAHKFLLAWEDYLINKEVTQ